MASFYCSTVSDFLAISNGEVLAKLSIQYANSNFTILFTDQTLAWKHDLCSLRAALQASVQQNPSAQDWGLLLEFSIPRKEKRIDIVLLIHDQVVILEAKSSTPSLDAQRQLQEYALLLHYFHKGTAQKHIVPILISPDPAQLSHDSLRQLQMFPQLASYWINPILITDWEHLPETLCEITQREKSQLDFQAWDQSPYHPVPNIIEAAVALRSGLSIREIAHSEASEHEISEVRQAIQEVADQAQANHQHAICFLTGVPGSGKTLVGLSLAHSEKNQQNPIHFMSGNGPLVKVLLHLFTQQGRREGDDAVMARTKAGTLIENVHIFARQYMDRTPGPPSNHAIIFDEAQRAWNKAQNFRKFKRDDSEPEMLLGIMERHEDWAVVVALVGGGQEINDGEAGLEEWGRALTDRPKRWKVFASPEVLQGGPSTVGHRLIDAPQSSLEITTSDAFHLCTSKRSLRAENLATWVNHLLSGEAEEAHKLNITAKFPIFLTRSLTAARAALRQFALGEARFGLVGSSGAARLRAQGLEPSSAFHAEYPWEHWYLAPRSDVRASFRCEVFATEFEIQGLELDWVGLCWGGDFVWKPSAGWQLRNFWPGANNRWTNIKSKEKRIYRENAYRVLLTRARQGMILFVPSGDAADLTTDQTELDATASFLIACGVTPLP